MRILRFAEIEGNMRVVVATFVNDNSFLFWCVRVSVLLLMYMLHTGSNSKHGNINDGDFSVWVQSTSQMRIISVKLSMSEKTVVAWALMLSKPRKLLETLRII